MKFSNNSEYGKLQILIEDDIANSGVKNVRILSFAMEKAHTIYWRMLQSNRIPGIIDLTGINENNREDFRFKLREKISLKNYLLEIGHLSDDEYVEKVRSILLRICRVIDSAGNYFLCENNFVLSTEFIFFDTEQYNVNLIYSPFDTGIDFSEAILSLVNQLFNNRKLPQSLLEEVSEKIRIGIKYNNCISNMLTKLFGNNIAITVTGENKEIAKIKLSDSMPQQMYNVGKTVWGRLFCNEEIV